MVTSMGSETKLTGAAEGSLVILWIMLLLVEPVQLPLISLTMMRNPRSLNFAFCNWFPNSSIIFVSFL